MEVDRRSNIDCYAYVGAIAMMLFVLWAKKPNRIYMLLSSLL